MVTITAATVMSNAELLTIVGIGFIAVCILSLYLSAIVKIGEVYGDVYTLLVIGGTGLILIGFGQLYDEVKYAN